MKVLGTTKILGIIGNPVSHSLSPVMHNAAIASMGLDYIYVPFAVEINKLATAVKGLEAIAGVVGFNLTIPHKQEILPFLAEITDIAKAVGAVNTVKRGDRGWIGTNTDVQGFLVPLRSIKRNWQNTQAVILGSGGAAKAAVVGCLQLGCRVIHAIGRDAFKLKEFHRTITSQLANQSEVQSIQTHTWADLENLLPLAGLVINTTPVGMGADLGSPLTIQQLGLIPNLSSVLDFERAIAYDLIYTPRPTKFLQMAQAQGLIPIDGLTMLLHQGAIALEFWTGQPAPIAVMAEALGL